MMMLQQRVSMTKLQSPAPTEAELHDVFKAAVRAPDHGKLQPWRFLVIQHEGLQHLSDVLVAATLRNNEAVSPALVEKAKNMPFRAPMILVAIAKQADHPKVPKSEQLISCGAAVQNMLNAFFALGYGAVWRTGELAYDAYVLDKLGVVQDETLIGFIYVGTPGQAFHEPPDLDPTAFFSHWPAI